MRLAGREGVSESEFVDGTRKAGSGTRAACTESRAAALVAHATAHGSRWPTRASLKSPDRRFLHRERNPGHADLRDTVEPGQPADVGIVVAGDVHGRDAEYH